MIYHCLYRKFNRFSALRGRVLCFLLLLSHIVAGQNMKFAFEHYTAEQGLSAPVTHITQDNYGFLWLGTTDGLNRFDGINFTVYRNIPGNHSSLTNNIINALYVDDMGKVWIATNGGLCYYDYADDQFHQVAFNDSIEVLDRRRVHEVNGDAKGNIWFATRSAIHKFNGKHASVVKHFSANEDMLIKYLRIGEDKIWIGSNEGVHLYIPSADALYHTQISSPFSRQNDLAVNVHPIIQYTKDTMLVGSWYGGLQKVYYHQQSLHTIFIDQPFSDDPRRHIVTSIAKGGLQDKWWIGTYGAGLALYDPVTSQFHHRLLHDPSDSRSPGSDYINDIFTDESGITWIGTTKGLDKFDPLTQQFSSITVPVPSNQFAVYRLINTIAEDKNDPDHLWLCVSGAGLYAYNKRSHEFHLYQIDARDQPDVQSNNIYAYYQDSKGRIWIGSRTGMYWFNASGKKFTPIPFPHVRAIRGVHTMFEDENGALWFATHAHGIYSYNEIADSLTHFSYNPVQSQGLPDNRVFCMIRDSFGKIWIGTQNQGLCRYDPVSQTFTVYQYEKNNPSSIPDNGVYDLFEDDQHVLWIATENGLGTLNLTNGTMRTYTTLQGLCNNTVFSITPDHRGRLWLGTNNGLSSLHTKSGIFRNYYINDGLPTNRIDGEVFLDSDNTLYFGTTGMLTFCRPDEMKTNMLAPPVLITNYTVLGKEVPVMRTREMLNPVDLSYRENMITFHFAALNFSNAFLNRYAYKLEGFDQDWIDNGHSQSATYTNLPGGTYTFRVKAANNDGTWNEAGTYAILHVHPPFWKTWWFYLLCLMAAAATLYLMYRIRINQIMKLQYIRSRIARDLHDDIGSTLSSINMISSMAGNGQHENRNELFSTISSASRQAMDLMSDIVWSINPKNDRMEMVIARMRQYASEILEAAGIPFRIELDESIHQYALPIEMRKDFYLIFKEAINNLAKYSGASQAVIRLQAENHRLTLSIEDDGKGFDLSKSMQGNGLRNMQTRAIQLKGKLDIRSAHGAGTYLHLTIPVSP